VRRRTHRLFRASLLALTGLLLLGGAPATGPARGPGIPALRQQRAQLQQRSRSAALELYALGSRLELARAELSRLDGRLAALRHEQATARREYEAALATLASAEQQLGDQLRLLYEQDQPDAIAVILGAASLEQAVEGLDNIKRIAHATDTVLDQARRARAQVGAERRRLAAQVARADAERARVEAGVRELEQARAERAAYLSQLRSDEALNETQVAAAERRAARAQRQSETLTAQARVRARRDPPPTPSATVLAPPTRAVGDDTTPGTPSTTTPLESPPARVEAVSQGTSAEPAALVRSGATLTVYATGYCLTGTTATGLPVGPGVVAVDPTVIPLGTRISIPGYGQGIAADTGGAIKGNRIDVWFASCQDALAFTRSVTITFL